MPITMTSWKL